MKFGSGFAESDVRHPRSPLEWVDWAFYQAKEGRLTASESLLLIALARHAMGYYPFVFPSAKRVEEMANLSRTTAWRAWTKLEINGLARPGINSQGRSGWWLFSGWRGIKFGEGRKMAKHKAIKRRVEVDPIDIGARQLLLISN